MKVSSIFMPQMKRKRSAESYTPFQIKNFKPTVKHCCDYIDLEIHDF